MYPFAATSLVSIALSVTMMTSHEMSIYFTIAFYAAFMGGAVASGDMFPQLAYVIFLINEDFMSDYKK